MAVNIAVKAFLALLIILDKGGTKMDIVLTFMGIFWLACKLFRLSWGQGDVYRERYRRYGNKEDLKKANEADSAMMFSVIIFTLVNTFVLCVIFH